MRQNYHKVQAKKIIIAAGAIERPLVFGNNDRPGIMLSSSAKEYLKIYGVLAMEKNLSYLPNNDTAYETAIEFKKNGVDSIILDKR